MNPTINTAGITTGVVTFSGDLALIVLVLAIVAVFGYMVFSGLSIENGKHMRSIL